MRPGFAGERTAFPFASDGYLGSAISYVACVQKEKKNINIGTRHRLEGYHHDINGECYL